MKPESVIQIERKLDSHVAETQRRYDGFYDVPHTIGVEVGASGGNPNIYLFELWVTMNDPKYPRRVYTTTFAYSVPDDRFIKLKKKGKGFAFAKVQPKQQVTAGNFEGVPNTPGIKGVSNQFKMYKFESAVAQLEV